MLLLLAGCAVPAAAASVCPTVIAHRGAPTAPENTLPGITGEYLQALGVEAYVVPARDITPAAVAYWHSYGLEVWTWTTDNNWPDNATEWQRARDAGVDTIITNHPETALAWRSC